MSKITSDELKEIFSHSIGTEAYHRLTLFPLNCTDGIVEIAEKCGAYWLCDVIASYQVEEKIKKVPFQVWNFTVHENNTADIFMNEDIGKPHLVKQHIKYTDFPVGTWKFYLIDNVLMVPNEY